MTFRREVAKRIFAKEFNDSSHVMKGNDRYSPQYLLTPTGARCNRVFVVGTLLEKEDRGDGEFWRIRVADPTGSFVGFIGRYQPEALHSLADLEPPQYVAVTAKINVFQGETRTLPSIRPEEITASDSLSRDLWVIETAKQTINRILAIESLSTEDAKLAREIYGTDTTIYREMVKNALEIIKGELEFERKAERKSEKEIVKEEVEENVEEDIIEDLERFLEEEEFDLSDI